MLDIFGPAIRLTYQGSQEFKTTWGAINSIICGIIVMGYVMWGAVKFSEGLALSISVR